MNRIHTWIPALVAATFAGAAVIACSDEGRVISSDPDDDTPPPPATTSDAGPPAPPPLVEKPPFDPADEAVTCAKEPCAVELVAGDAHFCARMSSGAVRCWGKNELGVLGRAPAEDEVPTISTVDGLAGATQLSTSGATACALVTDGAVKCWGSNSDAQLGLDPEGGEGAVSDWGPHPSPSTVALPGPAVRVDIGPRVGCAVLASGETWCWGFNGAAQLGRPIGSTLEAPALTSLAGHKAVRTAHGAYTSFAVTDKGEILSWGTVGGARSNLSGRKSSMELDPNPLPIGLGGVTKLAVTTSTEFQPPGFPQPPLRVYQHACAVAEGEVYCWGLSELAALGTGSPDLALKPTKTGIDSDLAWAQQVAVGGETTCVRLTDGKIHCAGDNRVGTLAIGDDAGAKFSMGFRHATELQGHAVGIAATRSAVCALLKTGAVACWGANDAGQLGQETKDDKPHGTPVTVKL